MNDEKGKAPEHRAESAEAVSKATRFHRMANDLYKKGDFAGAIELYSRALEFAPLFETYFSRGIAYTRIEDYDKAEADMKKAIEMNPACADAQYTLGYIYRGQQRYCEAIEQCLIALKIDRGHSKAEQQMTAILDTLMTMESLPDDLERLLDKLLASGDRELAARAHLIKGRILATSAHDFRQAMEEFDRAAETGGTFRSKALIEKGKLSLWISDLEGARECFASVLERDPRNVEAMNFLAELMRNRANYAEAERLYRAVLRLDKSNAPAYEGLAETRLALMDKSAAIDCYEKALSIEPARVSCLYELACLVKFEDPRRSFQLLQKAVEVCPEHAAAREELSFLQTLYGFDQEPDRSPVG